MEHLPHHKDQPYDRVVLTSDPVTVRLAAERACTSAEALLRSLPEDIFEGFYYAAYYGESFAQFGGQRGKCERGEWFPLVASLFTNNDGMSLSDEAADAAHLIAEERGIVS